MTGYHAVLATPLPDGQRVGFRLDRYARPARIDFLPHDVPVQETADEAVRFVAAAIDAYFRLPTVPLRLQHLPEGTPHQQRIWQALRAIPAGTTLTYGELASRLGSGPRAVAAACRANPLPLFIPCHRVVAAGGLGGYMGRTEGEAIRLKAWLLAHEQQN